MIHIISISMMIIVDIMIELLVMERVENSVMVVK